MVRSEVYTCIYANTLSLLVVIHHIDSSIPHYRARAATEVIKKAYPDLYLYESTPIFPALWRLATRCFITEKRQTSDGNDLYVFVNK